MRTGIQHIGTRLYVDDVRKELYRVRNEIVRRRDRHVEAFGDRHQIPCRVCLQFHHEIMGVRETIRHFGGTAHWMSRPEGW